MARVALRSSMPVRASLRLTGVPAAMLAARRRTRRSPLLQGSSPASSAAIAASQSMLASMVPWSLPSTAVMNRLVKSSRRSQQPVLWVLVDELVLGRRVGNAPAMAAQLRDRPELTGLAVEELLRLDGSFICIGRTARHDVQIDGHQVREGERVIIYWASANRDEAEFEEPDAFDLGRPVNRHVAFGAGPHRCVGSNLARMNLRIAVEEIVRRLHDLKLQPGADIGFHSTFNRAPLSVPITFTPGPR